MSATLAVTALGARPAVAGRGTRAPMLHALDTGGGLPAAFSAARGMSSGRPFGVSPVMRAAMSDGSSGGDITVELKDVPGVGPKTEDLLRKCGISNVLDLQVVYVTEYKRDRKAMTGFLKEKVGIIHQKRTDGIVEYISELADGSKDAEDKGGNGLKERRITFCIEGNISVGKTTFLQRIAAEVPELQDLVEVVPEPVDKWQNIKATTGDAASNAASNHNILEAFYEEPDRYAYTFQNYVFITRMMQEQESRLGRSPLRLMERSVFSDRMVFVRAVHEAQWLSDMEVSIYDAWFDPVLSQIPALVPDGFIYLRAQPKTCFERLLQRAREEENTVTLEYLEGLHQKHEDWLVSAARAAAPYEGGSYVGGVGQGVLLDPSPGAGGGPAAPRGELVPVPKDIQDDVYFLGGQFVHPSIKSIPALLLDCDDHIDMTLDIEVKRMYANKVRTFFEWAKARKIALEASESARGGEGSRIILPGTGGLVDANGRGLGGGGGGRGALARGAL